MKKSTLLLVVSLLLAIAMGIGGTLAYLQDTDEDVNVMTLGSVYIEQHEYERVQNADGSYEMVTSDKYGENYKLKEFTQCKPLYPSVGTIAGWGDYAAFDQLDEGASGYQSVFDGIENAVDKFVLVENTGKSDAYVRTIVALEVGSLDDTRDLIGYSYSDFWMPNEIGKVAIDGNNYVVIEFVYNGSSTRHIGGILPAGEYTYNSLGQVYLASEANNDDMIAIDGNGNGTFDILVVSQAVQAQGFDDAQTALDAAFGDITADNNPWKKDGADLDGTPVFPVMVSTADELAAAIAEGGEVYLTADIDLADTQITVPVGVETVLNLGGHEVTGAYDGEGHYAMFTIPHGASLTVNGPGAMDASTNFTASNRYGAIFENAGKLEINGGSYSLADSTTGQTWIIATLVDNRTSNAACETVLTINDGDFSVTNKAKNLFRNYPQQGGSATIVFNGGQYHKNAEEDTTYIWNQEAGSNLGELYFNGGTYESGIVYEDYNGQDDIHIADGVTISGYSGNN